MKIESVHQITKIQFRDLIIPLKIGIIGIGILLIIWGITPLSVFIGGP